MTLTPSLVCNFLLSPRNAFRISDLLPLAGMPVLRVWKAKDCIVMKRGMGSGYADVQNPVFFNDNTSMYFGDAKKSCDDLNIQIKERFD